MPQEIAIKELTGNNPEKAEQPLIEDQKEEIILTSPEQIDIPNLTKKSEIISTPESNIDNEKKVTAEQVNPLKEEKNLTQLENELKEQLSKLSFDTENWENDSVYQKINQQITEQLAEKYGDQEQKLAQEISRLAISASAGDMGTYGYLLDKWESEVRHWRKIHEPKI